MVGLAKLSEATLGIPVATVGLGISAGTGLTVNMAPGQIYQSEPLEATAISELVQNLSYNIIKQGISLNTVSVAGMSAPGTVGQSVNYLIEVQYADQDTAPTVLGFFNAATFPLGVQWNGPAGGGSSLTTIRKGVVSVQAKAGTAATTGTQTTPAPDSGWTGLAVVTIANGIVQILPGMISVYGYPPTVPTTLPAIPAALQTGQWIAYQDTGVASAYVITPSPPIASLIPGGTRFLVQFANANTGNSTLQIVGGAAAGTYSLWLNNQSGLAASYITTNMVSEVMWDGTGFQMIPGPAAWTGTIDGAGAALFSLSFIQ